MGTALVMGLSCFQSCDELKEWWNEGEEEASGEEKEETPQEDTSIDLQRELKAYYTFNDGTCTDISGNACHGILNGSPEVIDDTPTGNGCALFLNGYREQFINIPQNPLSGLKEATYSFWIKEFGPGLIIGVVGSNSSLSAPYCSYTQEESFVLNNKAFNGNFHEAKESWNMITVTQTQNEQKLYFNGVLYDTQSKDSNSSSGSKIQIGGNGDDSYKYWQSMKIDNIRIYSRALNAYEVAKIYEMESK